MSTGIFITFEGGEGAGKSTQAERLAANLRQRTIETLLTREVGGTPGAEAIRALFATGDTGDWSPLAEALLVSAARADHVERVIRPALENGEWVICDRFTDSMIVYQGHAGGLDLDFLQTLQDQATGGLAPDLTLIFDLDPEIGLARAKARDGGAQARFEQKPLEFHHRLRAGFLQIAENQPGRCAVIDAAQSADDLSTEIWRIIEQRLGDKLAVTG